jgi:hypothetical protein
VFNVSRKPISRPEAITTTTAAASEKIADMSDENHDYLWKRRHDIKVRALTNRLYYQERQRIFETREGLVKAASILAGTTAFAHISSPNVLYACAAVVTAASTLSLVFGYGQKARDSVKRSTEWAQLERDIDSVGERDFTEEQINQWFSSANDIEAGEPAAHPILLERCFERAVDALGGTAEIKLNYLQRHAPIIMVP